MCVTPATASDHGRLNSFDISITYILHTSRKCYFLKGTAKVSLIQRFVVRKLTRPFAKKRENGKLREVLFPCAVTFSLLILAGINVEYTCALI